MTVAKARIGYLASTLAILALSGCKPAQNADAQKADAQDEAAPANIAAPAAPTAPATVSAPPAATPAAAGPDVALAEISAPMTPAPTQPEDVANSHDAGFLKRFEGSKIVNYESLPFAELSIASPDSKKPDSWTFAPSEGQVTRIIYQVPTGHSTLELLRNYEQALQDVGFVQTGELRGTTDLARDFLNTVYRQSWETNHDYNWTNLGLSGVQDFGYVTAKATSGGKPVTVTVSVGAYKGPVDVAYQTNAHFEPGQPFVMVDILVSKAVVNQMVTVKAADMADALATKGVIDLYGIYFDTDKTVVKPESTATLEELSNLLKIDRSLKLEVSGHTDNAGSHDHNLTLSQGRAQAVVQALVGQYGIDPSRLVAKGYGDSKPVAPNDTPANMAKNRRVELRKI
jgi:outer membrane protein OmpA-like peptidoglycan-associated protein